LAAGKAVLAYGALLKRVWHAAVSAAAVISLSLTVGGCSNLATFLADNIPQWAGGLPKDAPPRAGDPRYAEYFKTQIAVRKAIDERRLAAVQIDEQTDRIERAQAAGGHMSRLVSARSFMRNAPLPDQADEADSQATTGFSLGGRTLY
jgi:hypothetical protein